MNSTTYLVTGVAGFIGSSLALKLLPQHKVIGVDNLYPNYPVKFKKNNLKKLKQYPNFVFINSDITNRESISSVFNKFQIDKINHLAALTGIRTSLKKPELYFKVNAVGTNNLYELAIKNKIKQFIFSSSSSVYGNSQQLPFNERQQPDPQSPYAKSKIEAEKMIKSLHSRNPINTTILRLFSVYGPNGRPDMAPYLFTEAVYKNKQVPFYGNGESARDYTYIDDVVSAIIKAINADLRWEIINIGNSSPIKLHQLTQIIEDITNKNLRSKKLPMNKAESFITYADITKAKKLLNWKPTTDFRQGMEKTIEWYKTYRLND